MSQSVAQLLATSERMLKRKKSGKKKAKKKASKKSKPRRARAKPKASSTELERLALQVALFGRPVRKAAKKRKAKAKAKPKKKKAKAKAKKPKRSSSSSRVKPNSRGTKAEREAWGRMMKRKRKAASK